MTSVGPINLRIPKLRHGSYFPDDLLVRYSRADRAVIAAVSEMVTLGVSTRKVERVAAQMGVDRMSSSQVSRICESLDDVVADLQARGLSEVAYPYIWLDARRGRLRSPSSMPSSPNGIPAWCASCTTWHARRLGASARRHPSF